VGGEGLTIAWEGRTIIAPPSPQAAGKCVTFYIRPEDVKLLYPDRPLTPTVQHNRFTGRVRRVMSAGAWVTVWLAMADELPDQEAEITLESRLPLRAYQALGLDVGATVAFSLRRDSIMLLPCGQETND
jgi:molybdate transport system ATP-binding protein